MILAVFSSILNVFEVFCYKYLLVFANSLGIRNFPLYFLGTFIITSLLLPAWLVFGDRFSWEILFDQGWLIPVLLVAITFFGIAAGFLSQFSFMHEKVSVLNPYSESTALFTIIIGFLFFHKETSLASFFAALVASLVLILAAIDWKNIRMNRYCAAMLLSGLFRALAVLVTSYLLIKLSFASLFLMVADNAISLSILFVVMIFTKDVPFKKMLSPKLIGGYYFVDLLWLAILFISMTLLKELGVVQTSLLQMLTLVFTLAGAYLFLREHPKGKDIIASCIVLSCISLGYYFS